MSHKLELKSYPGVLDVNPFDGEGVYRYLQNLAADDKIDRSSDDLGRSHVVSARLPMQVGRDIVELKEVLGVVVASDIVRKAVILGLAVIAILTNGNIIHQNKSDEEEDD